METHRGTQQRSQSTEQRLTGGKPSSRRASWKTGSALRCQSERGLSVLRETMPRMSRRPPDQPLRCRRQLVTLWILCRWDLRRSPTGRPPLPSALKGMALDAPFLLAIFDQSLGFPERDQATRTLKATGKDGSAEVQLHDLTPGTYAIGAFQDLNQDGILNRGAFGVPREPYGFSRDARGTFGPPTFEEAAFEWPDRNQEIRVQLK